MTWKEFVKVVDAFLADFSRNYGVSYKRGDVFFQHWFKVEVETRNMNNLWDSEMQKRRENSPEMIGSRKFAITFDGHAPKRSAWKVVDITERKPVVNGLMTLKIQQMWEAGL